MKQILPFNTFFWYTEKAAQLLANATTKERNQYCTAERGTPHDRWNNPLACWRVTNRYHPA